MWRQETYLHIFTNFIDELGDDERTESEEGFRNVNKRHSYVSGSGTIPLIPISPSTTGRSISSVFSQAPRKSRTFDEVSDVPKNRPPPPPPPAAAEILDVPQQEDFSDETTGYEADEDESSSPRASFHARQLSTGSAGSPQAHLPSRSHVVPPPPIPQAPQFEAPPLPPHVTRAPPPPPPVPAAPPIFLPTPQVDSLSFDTSSDLQGSDESDTTEQYEPSTGPASDTSTPAPPIHNAPPPPPRSSNSPGTPQGGFKVRRSLDTRGSQTRSSLDDQSYIAHDIDVEQSSQWWTVPNGVPSYLSRNVNNILYEIDDSQSTKRGGRITISRDIYILYHDYSQSVFTARYDQQDPVGSVSFEQTHTAPPNWRQDQLEDAYKVYGKKVLDEAQRQISAGSSNGNFVTELIAKLPHVLLPVGHRAYGALIYDNLANASVRQFDEIRPGDVVSFRNAHFQGHKGSLHQKYSADVGKDDNINSGVVSEWDGTKKKIKVYIQLEAGKGSGRVKQESYRLSDLKSGEVRVYRVVGRNYVGWE